MRCMLSTSPPFYCSRIFVRSWTRIRRSVFLCIRGQFYSSVRRSVRPRPADIGKQEIAGSDVEQATSWAQIIIVCLTDFLYTY
ncbi:hypothetical protein L208DRAFT_13334 [Tricholoma matsutake]|nr:hypothetical protein L208DRAFT_13334 [Tricholoma matsutake 945]